MPERLAKHIRLPLYVLAVIVMIIAVLDLALCPPCQICVGTRIGQVCIEDLVPAPAAPNGSSV